MRRWSGMRFQSGQSKSKTTRSVTMLKDNRQFSKPDRNGDSTNTETKTRIEKKGYKRAEAAIYLGVSKITIDRLTKRGLLRPSRALRHPIFSKDDLDRFLRETSEPIE
ncbi:MAG: helix-turn-helix domain-containing protein [Limisphaerales bacterium]